MTKVETDLESNESKHSTMIDKKETQHEDELEDYPTLLESAPFPTLMSVEEISRTLSRVKSNHTHKSELAEESKEEEEKSTFQHVPYPTEGFRNPGWLSVMSNFLANFFVFGSTFAWGNYQSLYLNEVYAGQTSILKISFVGTSCNALLLALGLLITPIIQRLGFRGTMAIGNVLAPLALILASFQTQLWHVYMTQGILFGMGAAFCFAPSVTLPSQWFTLRRSLATGIAVSGTGIGGVCISYLSQHLIESIGFRNALRVQGGIGFGILTISTCLAMSRYRPPQNGRWYNLFDRHLLSTKFYLLLVFCFLVPFAYIAPFFLAPQYAQSIGLDRSAGATMISVMSAANAVCRISLGFMADRIGRFNTLFLCTFLAGLFSMVVWQFATTYASFAIFCVLYGLTAGGFVSLLPVTTADIVGVENIQKGLGMTYMATVFGSLLGTPLIGLLYNAFGWTSSIQFTGGVTIASSLFLLILRFMLAEKFFSKV